MIIIRKASMSPVDMERVIDLFGGGPRGAVARMLLEGRSVVDITEMVKHDYPSEFEAGRTSSIGSLVSEVRKQIDKMVGRQSNDGKR